MLPLDGGEATALASYPKIVAHAWSPDGKRIAFVATAPHDPALAGVFHDAKSGARHIRKLPFKSDADGLLDGTRKQLYVVDAAGGEVRRLTQRRLRRGRAGLVARRRANRVLGPGRGAPRARPR